MKLAALCLCSLLFPFLVVSTAIPVSEVAQRRQEVYRRLHDGILFLHARSSPKGMLEASFVQDASFFYFTGLLDLAAAVLALDGTRQEAHLFVPPHVSVLGQRMDPAVRPGQESAARLGLDGVHPWEDLLTYARARLEAGVATFYVDEARHPEMAGTPEPMLPVGGELRLWRRSLASAFPEAEIRSAREVIRGLRWVKSPAEVEVLRVNAEASAKALLAGIRSLRPGLTQRRAEAAVVAACIGAGAEGPSFWPWVMSGPNAHLPRVVRSFFDYHHLDRAMRPGELVRVDVGCAGGGYGGDVGRTVPVSGRYGDGQQETWNLLVGAYRAGLAAMAPGVTFEEVAEASRRQVWRSAAGLRTDQARRAAEAVDGWIFHIHGVGIESGETGTGVLEEGTVLAYEPMFSVDGDAFYLEDMILVTPDGHEVLSKGLPYTAEEIEAVMAASG